MLSEKRGPSGIIERHGERWDAVDTAFAGSTERAE